MLTTKCSFVTCYIPEAMIDCGNLCYLIFIFSDWCTVQYSTEKTSLIIVINMRGQEEESDYRERKLHSA